MSLKKSLRLSAIAVLAAGGMIAAAAPAMADDDPAAYQQCDDECQAAYGPGGEYAYTGMLGACERECFAQYGGGDPPNGGQGPTTEPCGGSGSVCAPDEMTSAKLIAKVHTLFG